MSYRLTMTGMKDKNIYPLGEDFCGYNKLDDKISFTNYYMLRNDRPFFGVSGEFHFSRMRKERWEDELIKMKMGGINTVSTYVFWIHHEEEEGVFDFQGRRNLRHFLELCKEHELYVILRIGPFNHGEVRNGGLPDWLYGKPFDVRKINDGFLQCVKQLYQEIAKQSSGLFFPEGGPVIGVQIDNEYMHSSAPWEITTGVSNEWVFGGNDGDAYMLRLREIAAECGMTPVFYTCTGWGGATTPMSMMPLWGGYAFRPWIFYSHQGEHPATEEYIYQDFHNNSAVCTNDFKPRYQPEERPYACCEMGGGMTCCYYYRFQYPYKSVDAMANIKIASGCNFLGYYMFQGGSNPLGKHGAFLNEGQVPKISYDYQAALGEFGQVRESYRRLKNIHYFVTTFADRLCELQTVLPQGASLISPEDLETLRFAVRTDGHRGFLFVNNYQDHRNMPDRVQEEVTLQLEQEELTFSFGIAGDENAILPFHFDMEGIDLVQATAQLVTKVAPDGEVTYVFFAPVGMRAKFVFESGVKINGEMEASCYDCEEDMEAEAFVVEKEEVKISILVINRKLADQMFCISGERLVFTDGALLEDERGLRLETVAAENEVLSYPADVFDNMPAAARISVADSEGFGGFESEHSHVSLLGHYRFKVREKVVKPVVEEVGRCRYTVTLPENSLTDLKDALLQIDYVGDIGHAFVDGRMISDNFCNGAVWEIGLKDFNNELEENCITISITPLKKGANVNVESAMAARMEEVQAYVGSLQNVHVQPVYEIILTGGK